MTSNKSLLFGFLLLFSLQAGAQEFGQDSLADPRLEQSKGMVQTLAYYFNLLGENRASVSEKETIINSSYLKLFRDEDVQIEDDLQEGRSTVIYKDVQAYLKDIDFFFEEAYFEFEIDTVQKLLKEDSAVYYQVELIRNLESVSLNGDSLNTTQRRFVELNMEEDDELKIISIYTTKLSKEKQLREWWSTLTLEWRKVFQKKLGVYYDSLSTDELFEVVTLDSLDLSGNGLLLNLDPIYQLTGLKHLKISNTWINDLSPLLSINKLQSLDVSNTSVYDLQYLKYHNDIRSLDLSNCHVEDFSVLKRFEKLSSLTLNGIVGTDLSFIEDLNALEYLSLEDAKGLSTLDFGALTSLKSLYLQNADLHNLQEIGQLKSLTFLDVSSTPLNDLSGIDGAIKLEILQFNNTAISDLEPLFSLQQLERVYANGTPLQEDMVLEFSKYNEALLIRNSEELLAWWSALPNGLRNVLADLMSSSDPSVEKLSALIRRKELDLSQANLETVEYLAPFQSLEILKLDGNRIQKLEGDSLSDQLSYLSVNGTDLNVLNNIDALVNLEEFYGRNTAIAELDELSALPKIKLIDVDKSNVNEDEVAAALEKKPDLQIRFKSDRLKQWWVDLAPEVKKLLENNLPMGQQPNVDQLHALIALQELSFQSIRLTESFNATLEIFYRLESIEFQQVRLSTISQLPYIPELKRLSLLQMPIADLEGLAQKYPELRHLKVTNTAVEDLRPLAQLKELEHLNCSGTQVRRFRGLEELVNLKEIDCSNTRVFRLDRLEGLKNLEKLICFNTGLRQNDIDKLLEVLPDVEIVFY